MSLLFLLLFVYQHRTFNVDAHALGFYMMFSEPLLAFISSSSSSSSSSPFIHLFF